MEQEIINLADDIELKGNKRELFIEEMRFIISAMRNPNWSDFYKVADILIPEYI
jgi:hypothetical protein